MPRRRPVRRPPPPQRASHGARPLRAPSFPSSRSRSRRPRESPQPRRRAWRAALLHPALDVGLLARAVDDRGVVLVDHHLLGLAEIRETHVLELDAELL